MLYSGVVWFSNKLSVFSLLSVVKVVDKIILLFIGECLMCSSIFSVCSGCLMWKVLIMMLSLNRYIIENRLIVLCCGVISFIVLLISSRINVLIVFWVKIVKKISGNLCMVYFLNVYDCVFCIVCGFCFWMWFNNEVRMGE